MEEFIRKFSGKLGEPFDGMRRYSVIRERVAVNVI